MIFRIMGKVISIPNEIYQDLIGQAEMESPKECCGLLGGNGGLVGSRYPLLNRAAIPETSYFAAPDELFRAIKLMRERGEELIAIYHSHPKTDPYPSGKDLDMAFYAQAVYLIISLKNNVSARAFTIDSPNVFEVKIKII